MRVHAATMKATQNCEHVKNSVQVSFRDVLICTDAQELSRGLDIHSMASSQATDLTQFIQLGSTKSK